MVKRFESIAIAFILMLTSLVFAAGWAPYGPGYGLGGAPELGAVLDQATLVAKHTGNRGRSRLYDDLKIALGDPKVGEPFRRCGQESSVSVDTLVDGFSAVMDQIITTGKMRTRYHQLGERVLVVMGSDRGHFRRAWSYRPSEKERARVWTAYVFARGLIVDWGIVGECGNLEIFRVRYIPPQPQASPTPTPTPPSPLKGGPLTPGVSVSPELAGRKAGGYDYTITQTPVVPAPVLIPETNFPAPQPMLMRNGQKATIQVGSSTVQLNLANTVTGSGAVAIVGGGTAAGAVDVSAAGGASGVVTTPPIVVEYFPGN